MNNLTCTICSKPLTGGTDTFGGWATPMCQADYWEMAVTNRENEAIARMVEAEERLAFWARKEAELLEVASK